MSARRVVVALALIVFGTGAEAQHHRFTDGVAIAVLSDAGLRYEVNCASSPAGGEEPAVPSLPGLPPIPGHTPRPGWKPSTGGELAAAWFDDAADDTWAALAHLRAHWSPAKGCRWDVVASAVGATEGNAGARLDAFLLFPLRDAGALAVFASAQGATDTSAALHLQLDREAALGVSYTTPNLYGVTLRPLLYVFDDPQLDLRARVSLSGVAAGASLMRPDGERNVVPRLAGITALNVLQFRVAAGYSFDRTNDFIGDRHWFRHSAFVAWDPLQTKVMWLVLRHGAQGISGARRARDWSLHVTREVF